MDGAHTMTHAPTQAYGDAAFRDPLDIEDEDGAQPAFPYRPRALTLSSVPTIRRRPGYFESAPPIWALVVACSLWALVLGAMRLGGAL